MPKLLDLCMAAIADELLQGEGNDDFLSVIYQLPQELFDALLPQLPPLALHKLQEKLPTNFMESREHAYDDTSDSQKRRRCDILDTVWRALYKARWPSLDQQKKTVAWFDRNKEKCEIINDWQQKYWETHLQDCVDAIAETALLPSYDGSIGDIQIPDCIMEQIGCKDYLIKLPLDSLKFSRHCQQFGAYVRRLRLPNALCSAETCELFQNSKLGSLELQWIKSNDHVEGLYFVNAISDSLHMTGLQVHGVQHFSIKRSSFLQADSSPIPAGLASFLTSGRSLQSLTLCDGHLGRNFARGIFNSLLDSSSSLSKLDLSENSISGFLSQFRWRPSSCNKSLQSIRVLNLRSCNLERDDAESLRHALNCMPNLDSLDLSDNPIEDGVGSLATYFTKISSRDVPFTNLKLENCDASCEQMVELLGVLSTLNEPLHVLSIKGNMLGSKIGAPLGKFLCTGVLSLDAEDIGLGSSGFLQAAKEISVELKIAYINISDNQGALGAAEFIASLVKHANEIAAIDARYNLMPMHSLSVISSGLKDSKGKLKHLDLAGNTFCHQIADADFVSAELQIHGQSGLNVLLSVAPHIPYDNDP
ncbi:uncharacterized protein LOC125204047 isoform X2 [Salvia hispanica]|uniref:uncharacterized protein LOC125204047 isoform X2 n=1 Tax=Salvia hispanica TaxID=49212 RepID=UPI002009B48F|nr:uncharacterized protein LOC125204047 isoform X2 [Salvia hispanica]